MGDGNETTALSGGGVQLDTFTVGRAYGGGGMLPISLSGKDKKSVDGFEREWFATNFDVGAGEVEHGPTYVSESWLLPEGSPASRLEYPTVDTVSDNTSGYSGPDEVLRAILAPIQATADGVMMVPRMVWYWPSERVRSIGKAPGEGRAPTRVYRENVVRFDPEVPSKGLLDGTGGTGASSR
jgi:hypothetical protein